MVIADPRDASASNNNKYFCLPACDKVPEVVVKFDGLQGQAASDELFNVLPAGTGVGATVPGPARCRAVPPASRSPPHLLCPLCTGGQNQTHAPPTHTAASCVAPSTDPDLLTSSGGLLPTGDRESKYLVIVVYSRQLCTQ